MYDNEEDLSEFIAQAGDDAINWARDLVAHPDAWLILDTETTGLDSGDEIIQIAILNPRGQVLLNELVKPYVEISAGAEKVHHINKSMLAGKPNFKAIAARVFELLTGKKIITYNANFDLRLLWQTCRRYKVDAKPFSLNWECAMEAYAKYYGEYSNYHGSFRWQPLHGGDHSAAGDCQATLQLIHDMANTRLSTEKLLDSSAAGSTIKGDQ